MGAKEEIIKNIQDMTGRYSAYEVFSDWVECSALAIQNSCVLHHDNLWHEREQQYLNIMGKYNKEECEKMGYMFHLLTIALEEKVEDVLGEVYTKSGCYSKRLGQFFTPFHLAKMMADVALPDGMNEQNIYKVNEPSVGGGANIIALAKAMQEKGINYQKCLKVVAQDLDYHGVYMSYLQFSLLGIDAVVVQGDTLREPYIVGTFPKHRVFRTPRNTGAII